MSNDYVLPYDFVPIADKENREFPYSKDNIPKHNSNGDLSGIISYKIVPHSDLVIELREKLNKGYFISGSQIRGKVRTNLEILSASYPEFIDRSIMMYRDVSKKQYRQRLTGVESGSDIERTIQVGYLRKINNEYYVVPAEMIGSKNFLSIKEHRLFQFGLSSSNKPFSFLYKWQVDHKKKLEELDNRNDQITKEIKLKREQLKESLISIQGEMSDIFTGKYNLISLFNNNNIKYIDQKDIERKLEEIKQKLCKELENKLLELKNNLDNLNEISDSDQEELSNLYHLTAERWKNKALIHYVYSYQMRRYLKFEPYQKNIFFKRTANNGVESISFTPSDNNPEKAYLFNSTAARSKRSHYFVMEPVEVNAQKYFVPESVINGYKRNMEKFRIEKSENKGNIIEFYNIFEKYDELIKSEGSENGLIVFFKTDEKTERNSFEVSSIGRTPYFKIEHKTQLADILGEKEPNNVDYANALFGFIVNNQKEDGESHFAYKSRLRFSPVDIKGEPSQDTVNNLVLMTPQASASAMYLQQPYKNQILTYEDKEESLQLNGYKYYHVLKQLVEAKEKENKDILSSRKALKMNGVHLEGRIYFHNISRIELGLLLLSLDWKELQKSKEFNGYIADYNNKIQDTYELIGGAKPYGYGKVKIEVLDLQIEKKGIDFESLVLEPMYKGNDWNEYIDEFINYMGGGEYFEKVHFKHYIESKLEVSQDLPIKNWEDIITEIKKCGNGGGGYPKKWRLKSNRDIKF